MGDFTDVAARLQQSDAMQNLSAPMPTALFMGALTLRPAALVTMTSFTRIVIVLSFVRRAVTSQDIPPNLVITGMALFLTLYTMGPTLTEVNDKAVVPYLDKKLAGADALKAGVAPLQAFMLRQTRKQDLALFLQLSGQAEVQEPADT